MNAPSISARASAYSASILNYICRCIPGISTSLVIALILFAHDSIAFMALTLVYHVLIVAYAVRTCCGIYATWSGMLETANQAALFYTAKSTDPAYAFVKDGEGAAVAQHTESGVRNNELNFTTQIIEHDPEALIHAIFVPNYQEHLDTLRETLSMLASHDLARSSYEIYLAMESHEQDAELKAAALVSEFSPMFRYITYTIHPDDLPGEARGKSSNLAWATRTASRRFHNLGQSNVVLTVMDSDTHLLPSYFETINGHCASKGTDNFTMFVPPIVFDRNSDNISPIVRCADMYWSAAGIAGLYETSQIRTPTSIYSVTLSLARYVDFWDTGPEAIGEDLHMYLKCFFQTGGRLNTVPIYSPASHCNVEHSEITPDMSIDQRWMLSSQARFKQACRHMWGIMDSGYATRHAFALISSSRGTTGSSQCTQCDTLGEGVVSSVDINGMPSTPKTVSKSLQQLADFGPVPYGRIIILLHRLYEAHFLHVHYFIDGFACSVLPLITTIPRSSGLGHVLAIASYLRTIAFCGVMLQMLLYEQLYSTALDLRLQFVKTALSSPSSHIFSGGKSSAKSIGIVRQSLQQVDISRHGDWISFVDYILFPIAGAFYVIVPSLKAQILQFWSTEFVYEVSSKPVRSK
ncbi:hypothetical protein V1509DRAFT_630555 [Lipomyces kononenkoae]